MNSAVYIYIFYVFAYAITFGAKFSRHCSNQYTNNTACMHLVNQFIVKLEAPTYNHGYEIYIQI